MANALYDTGRAAFLGADVDWLADTIKISLVSSTYTRNLSTDDFYNDVSGVVMASSALGSKTSTAGVADAADVTYSAVTGSQVTQLVCYKDTGVSSTSQLIFNIDTATGLPVTPNGGDIALAFDSGANKIFKL